MTPGAPGAIGSASGYTAVHVMEETAADVLRYFIEKEIIRSAYSVGSMELQMLFSYYFFGETCWNCCSPFHGKDGCLYKYDNSWGPSDEEKTKLNKLRKKIHRILHL